MVLLIPVILFCIFVGRLWAVPVGVVSFLLPAYLTSRYALPEMPDVAAAVAVFCFVGLGVHHLVKLVAPGFARA